MSTGTNRERLEQNNTLLEGIKTQIQNLPEAGGSGDIKQFSTVEEMNNSTGNKEGDLAIVYRSEVQNATVDSRFQTATFPETVVLDTAITGNADVRYRAVDDSVMFDCMGQFNSSSFMMDCYTESGSIRIQYTSSDGITYTRTDTTGNPVDFGTEIYYERAEHWNDAIGKFIQVGGNKFEGLFKYAEKTQSNIYTLKNPKGGIKHFDLTTATENAKKDLGAAMLPYTRIEEFNLSIPKWDVYKPTRYVFYKVDNARSMNIVTNGTSYYLSPEIGTSVVATFEKYIYENDTLISSETITIDTASATKLVDLTSNTYSNYDLESGTNVENGYIYYQYIGNMHTVDTVLPTTSSVDSVQTSLAYSINTFPLYIVAPTQLNATSDYVYGKEFYGKNGAESGTLQNKENLTKDEVKRRVDIWANYSSEIICPSDASYMLGGCTNLTTIPQLNTSNVTNMAGILNGCTNLIEIPILDTGNVTNIDDMFNGCSKLIELPLLDFSKVESAVRAFMSCTSLTTVPLFNTEKLKDMSSMFAECTNLATIPQLNTSSVTTMYNTFNNCTNLTTIPLLDTSNVTTMNAMFSGCTNLTTLPLLNTSNVTNMNSMFVNCTNLTTIPLLDTSNATTMNAMFSGCTNLTTLPLLNTSGVTSMNSTFNDCTSLTTLPLLNTSGVTSMNSMFYGCTSLTTIPLLDTSSVTSMTSMFYGCTSLTTISQLDTSNVTDMTSMFENCRNLTTISQLDTSNVTYMSSMFYGCESLTEIPLLNISSVTYMSNMFSRCTNLTTVPILDTSSVISMSNTFSRCPSLSDESLNNILAMCTNATSYTSSKTLKYIGLTQEQATKCTTLSNYSAFTSAGWTTGY